MAVVPTTAFLDSTLPDNEYIRIKLVFNVNIIWLIMICGAVGLVNSLTAGKEAAK